MKDIYGTAIYPKNVGPFERTVRLLLSLAAAAFSLAWAKEPWMMWLGVGSAIMFALTGAFGFCPACYLAGRRKVS
jgi:hypothetical protein